MRNVLKPMKKQFSYFYFLRYARFCTQNWPKCHHKWPNYWVLLRFCLRRDWNAFQNMLRAWKKVSNFFLISLKKIWLIFFFRKLFFFSYNSSEAYGKKISIKIGARKNFFSKKKVIRARGACPHKPPGSWGSWPRWLRFGLNLPS